MNSEHNTKMSDQPLIPTRPNASQVEMFEDLSKDPYFQYIVQKEVETRTRAQLGWWWKFIGGALGLIIAVFSFIGYRESSNLAAKKSELEKTIEQVRASASTAKDEISKNVDITQDAVREINRAGQEAKDRINEGKQGSKELIDQERQAVQDLVDRLFRNYEKTQSLFRVENEKTLADNQRTTEAGKKVNTEVATSLQTNKDYIQTLEKEKQKLAEQITAAMEKLKDIQSRGRLAEKLTGMESELKKAQAFEFVFLEARKSKQVEIYNSANPSAPYKITFTCNGLATDGLKLTILLDGRQEPQLEPVLAGGSKRPILGADGLYYEVVAVRHRTLAHDFAMLKVYYRNASNEMQIASQ
jgi:outer membrane murein-binding lipoprotein Lpp